MTMEEIVAIQLRMESLISEREGMLAANQYREMQGYTQAYGEEQFFSNADQFKELAIRIEEKARAFPGVKVRVVE